MTLYTDIAPDERLLFFPTLGSFDRAAGEWQLPIHAWVFRPELDSRRRAAALAVARRLLRLDPQGEEAARFDGRMRAFLVDNQPQRVVVVRIGDREHALAPSPPNGHVIDVLRLPADEVERHLARDGFAQSHAAEQATAATTESIDRVADVAPGPQDAANVDRWLSYTAVLPPGHPRRPDGAVQLLDTEGLSVVSDIDDTIKLSHVGDRRALLRQTFLREFEPVPGMSQVYARWYAAGASFHYVSRSPWQLFLPLREFFDANGFPRGTFHMRNFRWREGSTLRPSLRGTAKRRAIQAIFDALPQRRFVLVGDSGQRDPEVYGQLARDNPGRVAGVFIRNVRNIEAKAQDERATAIAAPRDAETPARYREAFASLPRDAWRVFDDPAELPESVV